MCVCCGFRPHFRLQTPSHSQLTSRHTTTSPGQAPPRAQYNYITQVTSTQPTATRRRATRHDTATPTKHKHRTTHHISSGAPPSACVSMRNAKPKTRTAQRTARDTQTQTSDTLTHTQATSDASARARRQVPRGDIAHVIEIGVPNKPTPPRSEAARAITHQPSSFSLILSYSTTHS